MTDKARYESPLSSRYASPAMLRLWTAEHRSRVWRQLWLTLAQEQQRLGIGIPQAAIEEMQAHLDDVDLEEVRQYEHRIRHDVMAHIHHFGDQAPAARPFLHLGAASAYVTDNADLIVMRDGVRLLLARVAAVVQALRAFAARYGGLPTVAYTHFQPAQLTTVGKRATLWLQDFLLDAQALRGLADSLPFRGCKGTTGTQASYLELFHGDHDRVRQLDQRVAEAFGFASTVAVSGQTYTRKVDSRVLDALSGVAQSAAKFANDVRLLQHEQEVMEPAEREQVGSSSMPYKRNPMRTERVCALARYVLSLQANAHHTVATQWLERTLDDSANRRLALPDAFLATDAILVLCTNVSAGLEVQQTIVRRNVERVMPFMATERWLMLGVEAGGDRQQLHEVIRRHSRGVAAAMAEGGANDLLERLAADPAFASVPAEQLRAELDPARYVGRAPEQVRDFLDGPVEEVLESLKPYAVSDQAAVTV
ncbi:MAG: adenylosuccinate lyase [Gemmatimonadales bacterium]|nr:adenylosuccinate lyase [Gemmatimonadales bacterium]NIN11649.1 adenylosuccinate lyase [Gemmatimonadales bacterium]NIN50255.1 adenylosuccinate lyase [Gemmatimonadales bacterium]NIP07719.1 adenylosuccinate lyase [Gemmatimonadales bacterium]NIQ99122.1 adenylosuccinate lyase [Gemmatimonadales bacterium]